MIVLSIQVARCACAPQHEGRVLAVGPVPEHGRAHEPVLLTPTQDPRLFKRTLICAYSYVLLTKPYKTHKTDSPNNAVPITVQCVSRTASCRGSLIR